MITSAGRAESITLCRDVVGAADVIDYRAGDFAPNMRELTGGRGADVVLDPVGDETFRRSIDCVAPGRDQTDDRQDGGGGRGLT